MSPDDLARILDELGQRLGPTGEHVFELAVRQVYITSLIALVVALILVAGGFVCVWLGRWMYRYAVAAWNNPAPNYSRYGNGPDLQIYVATWGIAAACFWVVGAFIIGFALPPLLNPEYAALRDILEAVSGTR